MEIEEISRIEILGNGEMFLVLASGGKPMYQYIYREAAEAYRDKGKSDWIRVFLQPRYKFL